MGYRNLFPARIDTGGAAGRVSVRADDITIDGTVRSADLPAPGSPVTVAIRPEDLRIGPGAAASTIKAVAEIVEYHGRELSVRTRTSGGAVLHVKTPEPVVAGETVTLTVPPERVLVYAGAETESHG
jgi:putative spermidine/putrescine transport system ATP-binding protein